VKRDDVGWNNVFDKLEAWKAVDFTVSIGSTYQENAVFVEPVMGSAWEDDYLKVSTKLDITYKITPPSANTLYVDYLYKDVKEHFFTVYNNVDHTLSITAGIKVGVQTPWYKEHIIVPAVKSWSFSDYASWTDPLGATHQISLTKDITVTLKRDDAGKTIDFSKTEQWRDSDFKVFRDSTNTESAVFDEPSAYEDKVFKVSTKLSITYSITTPLEETIHVKFLYKDVNEFFTVAYNEATDALSIRAGIRVGVVSPWYLEQIGGRYEWTIVGRDSAAVDSAGAGMVTAGYKNKQIEIGLTGLDMKDNKFGPRIPYVHRFWTGAGTDRYTYYDTLKQWDAVGRAALQDDYCHTWPISSSNIITVGGPAANLASEYWNDFTSAFMTGPYYSKDYPNFGLYSLGSWDYDFQQGVSAGGAWGFAIVSTYKDLNGTAGFIVWGWTGDDTYFITKWLHEPFLGYPSGLAYLQDMNPCATTIKIDINYSNHPPTVWIPRTLGTISEKPQHYDP